MAIDFRSFNTRVGEMGNNPLAPETDAAPTGETVEDGSLFWEAVNDTWRGPLKGVEDGLQSVGSLLDDGLELIGVDVVDDSLWEFDLVETKTIYGGLLSGISQFAIGLIPGLGVANYLGKAAKATKAGSALSKSAGLSKTAQTITSGAVADFTAFREHEDRFSNMLQEWGVESEIIDYLAADEDDSFWEGRLKNAIEGGLLGGMLDTVVAGARLFKAARKAAKGEASADDVAKAAQDVDAASASDAVDQLGEDIERAPAIAAATLWSRATGQPAAEFFNSPQFAALTQTSKGRAAVSSLSTRLGALFGSTTEKFYREFPDAVAKMLDAMDPEGALTASYKNWLTKNRVNLGSSRAKDYTATVYKRYLKAKETGNFDDIDDELLPFLEAVDSASYNALRPLAGTDAEDRMSDGMKAVMKSLFGKDRSPITESERFNVSALVQPENSDAYAKEFKEQVREKLVKAHELGMPLNEAVKLSMGEINFDQLKDQEEMQRFLQLTAEAITEVMQTDRTLGDVMKNETALFLASQMGLNRGEVVNRLDDLAEDAPDFVPLVLSGYQTLAGMAQKIHRIAQDSAKTGEDLLSLPENEALIENALRTYKNLREIIGNAARVVQSGNIVGEAVEDVDVDRAMAGLKALKGGDRRRAMASLATSVGGDLPSDAAKLDMFGNFANALNRMGEKAKGPGRWLRTYWLGSLLSGMTTHIANFTGNSLTTALIPVERFFGGAVQTLSPLSSTSEGLRNMRDGYELGVSTVQTMLDVTLGMLHLDQIGGPVSREMRKGGKAVLQAAKENDGVLTRDTKLDVPPSSRDVPMNPTSPTDIKGIAGSIITLPFRALTTADEFFKQVQYRSNIRAEAVRAARQRTFKDAQERERFIVDYIKESFTPDGRATYDENLGEFIRPTAMFETMDATFQHRLMDGTLAQTLQDAAEKHPLVKVIFPFVKTPTNIISKAMRYTPVLAPISKRWRQMATSDNPDLKAKAAGEIALGAGFWVTALYAASTGTITGNGPSNPDERRVLEATGWQPLSVKVGDRYISFARIEPLAMVFGLAADLADVAAEATELENETVAMAMIGSVLNNMQNKTYMTGLRRAVMALQDPKNFTQRYIGGHAASLVPRALSQFSDDPYLREARTILEQVRNRIPGLAEGLPPRRDILGQPAPSAPGYRQYHSSAGSVFANMHPFSVSVASDDPARNELAALNFAFSPPVPKVRGVDLRELYDEDGTQAYDQYQRLVGEVGGQDNLHAALNELVTSPEYQELPLPYGENDSDNPRVKAVQGLISQYRAAAFDTLLEQRPDVLKAIETAQQAAATGTPIARLERQLNN